MSSPSTTTSSRHSGTTRSTQDSSWIKFEPWSCEAITPDMCSNLEVDKASVVIRGINVVYWRYSSSSKKSSGPPIVIVPSLGMPHDYLLPLTQQACRGRTVYLYDPAGTGDSIIPKNTTSSGSTSSSASEEEEPPPLPSHLEELDYYALEELPTLLRHWDLLDDKGSKKGSPSFHLYGHSEGGIIAMLYAIDSVSTKHPSGMESLILASSYSDKKLHQTAQWDQETGTLGRLPVFVQERMQTLLQKQDFYRSQEYWEILKFVYRSFYMRTHPSPECLMIALERSNWRVHSHIVGVGGNFWQRDDSGTGGSMGASWSITSELRKLPTSLPVLLMTGGNQFDTTRPVVTDLLEKNIPLTERIEFVNAGHMHFLDDPGAVNHGMADFLDRVEARGKFRPREPTAVSSIFSGVPVSGSTSSGTHVQTAEMSGSRSSIKTGGGSSNFENMALFLLIIAGGLVAWRKISARQSMRATYSQLQV